MPAELPGKKNKIREIYNPQDDEKKSIDFVYTRKREMEDSPLRKNAELQWDKSEKQWEALREDRKPDDWQSNHYVPLTQSNIETALSEFVDQTPHPFFLPRGAEDKPKIPIINAAYDYTREVGNQSVEEYNIFKDALTYGTGIGQEYYWQEKRIIQNRSVDSKGNATTDEEEVIDFDDPYLEVVKLQDFFIDEYARGFTGPRAARDCIRRYIMDIDDFKVMFSGDTWDPFNNAQYVKPGGDVDYYEYYKPPEGIDKSKQVEVLWYWAEKPKDWLIIVANDVLIRKGPNPYKHKKLPFVRAIAVKRVHSFYGKGIAEILESTQDETNTIRRMTIDRSHLDIDKMFMVSSRLGLDDSDLIARPHGLIPTDDVNGAKAVEYGDVPRSVELTLNHLEDDAIISTGINPRAQALPQAGTATEAAILKESTLKRLRLILWLFKYEMLIPHAKLRVANIIQFYAQPKLEKLVGDARTQAFKAEVGRLKAAGQLVQEDGENYKQSYRNIRLEGKAIDFDDKGQPKEVPNDGMSFFELQPKYFVPVCSTTYDVKFRAGADLEISKPLMRQQMLELSDRVMNVALNVEGSYDPVKVMDSVIEAYDKDPQELKVQKPEEDQEEQRLSMVIELAGMENKQMMAGQEVTSTPYAPPVHTRAHIEFMQSEPFQQVDQTITDIFTRHVVGELFAQEARAGAGAGGEEGGQTAKTSVSQGITNRPNGMAQPSSSMEKMMPDRNTGQNRGL